jgi:hypothetical protein
MRIPFERHSFEQFLRNPSEQLDEAIARAAIRMKLQHDPVTQQERENYQNELNRLTALKYLHQYRKGKLSLEEFSLKVQLVD